jgi:hypothetical protein
MRHADPTILSMRIGVQLTSLRYDGVHVWTTSASQGKSGVGNCAPLPIAMALGCDAANVPIIHTFGRLVVASDVAWAPLRAGKWNLGC